MVLFLAILLNLLVVLFFLKFKKKNIHKLEIVTYWMVSSILFQNYSAFNYMNLKYFVIPNILSLEMAHVMNRLVLFPVLIVMFLNHYVVLSSFKSKFLLVISYIVILTGLEWLADWAGILNHINWKLWWSIVIWICILLISIGFMKFFRKKWMNGGRDI
jgi:hypothetical protein